MDTWKTAPEQRFKPLTEDYFILLLLLGFVVNTISAGTTIMDSDGTLYASVAKTIIDRNDWVNLYAQGKDWLDKPHFPFWVTAISYAVFGINNFAYKFPALVFWAIGAWYTLKFARIWYSETVARLAVLIYITALHLVISNNDVRAEPYLTGFLIAAVYHYYKASLSNWSWHIVAGSLFTAAAIMTKGIFIGIPIAGAFIIHWALTRDWRQFRRGQWWVAILLVLVFILPELYCLYHQFDLHPEKVVFGRTGVSGLRFFFWDSQFGRFMNTGPIKGKGDPLFYVHTLLWAFLPWSIVLYVAVGTKLRLIIQRKTVPEYLALGISLICFLLFSASRFQLPHYLNIVFPFFAVLSAGWLVNHWPVGTAAKYITISFKALVAIQVLAVIGLTLLLFQPLNWPALAWLMVGLIVLVLFARRQFGPAKWVGSTYLAAIVLYGFLNLFFYPELLRYQSGGQAAEWLNRQEDINAVYIYDQVAYSLDFYSEKKVVYTDRAGLLAAGQRGPVSFYGTPEQLDTLRQMGVPYRVEQRFPHYHISKLTLKFLRPETRQSKLQERVIARINPIK